MRRETHFLDWRWRPDLEGDASALARCWHETFFDAPAHADHPDLIALDSTPSYLLQSNLAIPRLSKILGGRAAPPLVVMVRDPVARAASHYAMIADPRATPQQRRSRGTAWLDASMRAVAEAELADLVSNGVLRRRNDGGGSPTLAEAYDLDDDAFRRCLGGLPLGHGAHSLLLRGCYAAQLKPWREAFGVDALLVLRCEDMATPAGARDAVAAAQRHCGLREHPLDDATPKNSRAYAPPDSALLADLGTFYAALDEDLYAMLGWGADKRWR